MMRREASLRGDAPGRVAGEFAGALDERHKQIRIEIADFALQDSGEAFEARAGVDRRLRQRRDRARRVAIELHEDEIPDFDVAAAFAAEFAIGVALIGRRGAHVVVNFAARAAGAGVAHGPEIFFQAGDGNYAIARRADVHPQIRALLRRCRELFRAQLPRRQKP